MSSVSDNAMELLDEQGKLYTYLKNFIVNSIDKAKVADRNKFAYERRLEILNQYWQTFMKNNLKLSSYCNDPAYKDNVYFKEDLYTAGENFYVTAGSRLQSEIEALNVSAHTVIETSSPNTSTRLAAVRANFPNVPQFQTMGHSTPKLPVPKFDGTQKEWDSFKELFTANIINYGRLSDAVKLQHLVGNVSGPAKKALKGIPITSANFQVAWNKLRRRYDNDRRRLYVYLEALINLPQVPAKSAQELTSLVDEVEEAVKGLNDLNCPVAEYDNWFVHLIVKRLDADTRKDWQVHEEKVEGFSTYANLLLFLENRIVSLTDPNESEALLATPVSESKNKSTGQRNIQNDIKKSISSHHAQDRNQYKSQANKKPAGKCLYCSGDHLVYKCSAFLKLNAVARLKHTRSQGRSPNCFSNKHTSNCPSERRCTVGGCNEEHNSLLHADRSTLRVHAAKDELDVSAKPGISREAAAKDSASYCSFSNKSVLLATAKVVLRNKAGDSRSRPCRLRFNEVVRFKNSRERPAVRC